MPSSPGAREAHTIPPVSAQPQVPRRALVFWTATTLIAVDTILFTMVVPALPEYQDRYGFSDAVASLIFAAFPVGMLVTALWAAGLVDRFGRRPVMILAALTLAAATLAFALANGVPVLAVARLVQGLAAGLVWTAALAAISDVYPQEELGFRMGLAETAGGVMGLVGPPFAGVLIAAVGLDATFYIATALPVLALVPTLLVPETRRATAAAARLLPDLRRLLAGAHRAGRGRGRSRPRPRCWRWSSRCCRWTSPTASSCRRSGWGSCSGSGSPPTSCWCRSRGAGRTGAGAVRRSSSAAASWRSACRSSRSARRGPSRSPSPSSERGWRR